MESRRNVIILLLLNRRRKHLLKENKRKRCPRKYWVDPILLSRNKLGAGVLLINELRLNSERFHNYLRMSGQLFDNLLAMVGPRIVKDDCFREDVISPTQRLALTLRFLASGDSMMSLHYSYRMSVSSVSNIIRETMSVIWDVLHQGVFIEYTASCWKTVAEEFERRWNFPHCIGAIDGKHIIIQAPQNSGSTFFNYKKSHSIILLAIADADYCFVAVDIGAKGRESDGGVFKKSSIGEKLANNALNIPPANNVGKGRILPYVIVADEAFPLTTFMLRPFPGRGLSNLDEIKNVFNYRLSRARRIVENAFGVLAAKWRIFRRPINCDVNTVINIVKSTVCLHNYIRKNDKKRIYIPKNLVDDELDSGEVVCGQWRNETKFDTGMKKLPQVGSNFYSRQAALVRNEFAEYFVGEGSVPWQWNRTHN